jgi:hypothetical protein
MMAGAVVLHRRVGGRLGRRRRFGRQKQRKRKDARRDHANDHDVLAGRADIHRILINVLMLGPGYPFNPVASAQPTPRPPHDQPVLSRRSDSTRTADTCMITIIRPPMDLTDDIRISRGPAQSGPRPGLPG